MKAQNTASTPTKVLTHDSGLILKVPETLVSADPQSMGYNFNLSDPDSRSQSIIKVRLLTSSPFPLKGSKVIDGVKYFYLLETYNEGSGGAEHSIKVWKPFSEKLGVYITHIEQSDLEPSFELLWLLAQNSEYR